MTTIIKKNHERDNLKFYFKDLIGLTHSDYCKSSGRMESHLNEVLEEYIIMIQSGDLEDAKSTQWYQVWKRNLPAGFIWDEDESWHNLPIEVSRKVFFEFHDIYFE